MPRDLKLDKEALERFLKNQNKAFSALELHNALNSHALTKRTLQRYLAELTNNGKVEKAGEGCSTKYQWIQKTIPQL